MHHRLQLPKAHRSIQVLYTSIIFECFLTSADAAADLPVNPTSAMTFELSGEIAVKSRAAGLLQYKLETNMSTGLVRQLSWLNPLSASHLTLMPAQQKCLNQYISDIIVSYDNTSLSLTCCCMVPQRI